MLRVFLGPGMPQPHVIGDEIEHQLEAPLYAQTCQGRVAAQSFMYRVTGNGEARAGDILVGQVRQRLFEFPSPLRVGGIPAALPGQFARR